MTSGGLETSGGAEASVILRRMESAGDRLTLGRRGRVKGSSHSTTSCSKRDDGESDIGDVGDAVWPTARGETGSEFRCKCDGVMGRGEGCTEGARGDCRPGGDRRRAGICCSRLALVRRPTTLSSSADGATPRNDASSSTSTQLAAKSKGSNPQCRCSSVADCLARSPRAIPVRRRNRSSLRRAWSEKAVAALARW